MRPRSGRGARSARGALRRRGGRAASEESGGSDSEGFFDALGLAATDESPPEHIIVPATAFYDAGAPPPAGAPAPCRGAHRQRSATPRPAACRRPPRLPAQARRRAGNSSGRLAQQRAPAARASSSTSAC